MNISSETNLLVNNVINAVRNLETQKGVVGDEASLYIKEIGGKLKKANVPNFESSRSIYIEEGGFNIDFWIRWDGKMFLTSSDSPDDFQPILGQTIQSRVNFVKILPCFLRDMENHFVSQINEFNDFLNDVEDFNEDDLFPEEMSERDKDIMMMNGIED
jgi:hypothetical protein